MAHAFFIDRTFQLSPLTGVRQIEATSGSVLIWLRHRLRLRVLCNAVEGTAKRNEQTECDNGPKDKLSDSGHAFGLFRVTRLHIFDDLSADSGFR